LNPTVIFEHIGERQSASARLVIGADGRGSQVRGWAGFERNRNLDQLTIAGMLVEGAKIPADAVHLTFGAGCATILAPMRGGRARIYFVYPNVAERRKLSGDQKIGTFLKSCRATGFPEAWLADAVPVGPLAEFNGADRWVESPARNSVALIGDAAAASDPSWSCGLSLTLTDVEHLAKALRESEDWTAALHRYAREHDEYYDALRRILGWMTDFFWAPGLSADERRSRVFPRMKSDPRGFPDYIGQGPFGPNDEQARRLILGLD
jgi:2-polyprenyl-6-methoxyphenol hydroxylase-like FAD-dependent oxidoreductase